MLFGSIHPNTQNRTIHTTIRITDTVIPDITPMLSRSFSNGAMMPHIMFAMSKALRPIIIFFFITSDKVLLMLRIIN